MTQFEKLTKFIIGIFMVVVAFLLPIEAATARPHDLVKQKQKYAKMVKQKNKQMKKRKIPRKMKANGRTSVIDYDAYNKMRGITESPKPEVRETPVKRNNDGGKALVSWYGPGFHGRLTASGQRFNQNAMTAAHKSLPFGTKVKVTNVKTGKSVVVTINDRGPYIHGRTFDLSKGAFHAISSHGAGTATVEYEILSLGDGRRGRS